MKKVLIKIIITLIILILLATGGYFGYKYYLEITHTKTKQNFYKYAFQNNFSELFDTSFLQNIKARLLENEYQSNTDIEISNTFPNNSNFSVDKLTLNINTKTDKINKKTDFNIDYSNNKLFNISILSNPKYIGIKVDDVLNNYMAIKKENISNTLEKIDKQTASLYQNINKLSIKKSINNTTNSENYNDYIELFEKYVSSNNYKDEGIAIIEQNGNNIETQRYALTISGEEAKNVFAVITEKIIEDESFLNKITTSQNNERTEFADIKSSIDHNRIIIEEENEIHAFRESDATNTKQVQNFSKEQIDQDKMISKITAFSGNLNTKITELEEYNSLITLMKYFGSAIGLVNINVTPEIAKEDLNKVFADINNILETKLENNSNVKIISYVSNDSTIRTSVFLGENIEIVFDYIEKEKNKNRVKISILEKKEEKYNGYAITLEKIKTSVIDTNNLRIEFIENSEIVNKLELKLNIEGSEKSKEYKNTLNILYSGNGNEGKIATTLTNKINFKKSDVEQINAHNCVLLDDLETPDFNYLINKFNFRLNEVYEKQLSKMNLINSNTSDKILQNNNKEEIIEDTSEKDALIDVLVDTISNQMGEAELEEKEYTIQNLKDLQIEGYDVQVSVSQDLAIITINGYKFKIDKDFNLSE
ncbi:MAG: hypothetical protein J6J60_03360 [Clostridia bacterium]|nr:hypothetical protein [Clostridia bacterium]